MPDISIVVPCYNEKSGVAASITKLQGVLDATGHEYEILAVDDGSSDNTGEILSQFRSPVRLIKHSKNLGYGASIKHGIRRAKSPIIAITDADGTYPAESLPELLTAVASERCDMAVGSRTGANVSIPLIRVPAKWALRMLANYVAGFPIPDINSGLRVFRRDVAEQMIGILPDGFSATTTITLAMLTNGYQVEYQPIDYFQRLGSSKIRPIRDTLNFLQLTIKMALYFAPLKVFIPLSIGLFLLAVVWAVLSLLLLGAVADVSTLILAVASLQIGSIGMVAELVRWTATSGLQKRQNDD